MDQPLWTGDNQTPYGFWDPRIVFGAGFNPMGHFDHQKDVEAIESLVERAAPRFGRVRVVEVGTWAGALARLLVERHHARVYAVDTWLGNPETTLGEMVARAGQLTVYEVFCRNMEGWLCREVIPLWGPSALWASLWDKGPVGQVDLVFIDADHRYEEAKQDIEMWWPHVRPGGILCGHDSWDGGVSRALEAAISARQRAVNIEGISVWWTNSLEKGESDVR